MSSKGSLRVTEQAYDIARNRANEECISMCQWISKAIMEKAILDDLVASEENE